MKHRQLEASLGVRALWRLAGVVPTVMMRRECELDRARYAILGTQVLVNAVIAGALAANVTRLVTHSARAMICWGLLWAAFIALVDMAIMSGVRRRPDEPTWHVLRRGASRIALAVVVGMLMSAGLEQAVHADVIGLEVERMHRADALALDDQLTQRYADLQELRDQIGTLERELTVQDSVATELRRAASAEADGTGGTRDRGLRDIYRDKKQAADDARERVTALQAARAPVLRDLRARLEARSEQRQRDWDRADVSARSVEGFTARYVALRQIERHELKGEDIKRVNLFLRLLAMIVELTPLLLKLTAPRGTYESVHDRIEARVVARADAGRAADEEHMQALASARRARRSAFRMQLMRVFDNILTDVFQRPHQAITVALSPDLTVSALARLRRWIHADLAPRFAGRSSGHDTDEPRSRASARPRYRRSRSVHDDV